MKKRFLSLILGLCLCLGLMPSVSAYEAGIVGQASTIGVGANNSFGFVDKMASYGCVDKIEGVN